MQEDNFTKCRQITRHLSLSPDHEDSHGIVAYDDYLSTNRRDVIYQPLEFRRPPATRQCVSLHTHRLLAPRSGRSDKVGVATFTNHFVSSTVTYDDFSRVCSALVHGFRGLGHNHHMAAPSQVAGEGFDGPVPGSLR
ncbi:hypothetical protein LSAT2_021882 [Lamellibrachia satsuma]|nr:hypothetical protein LSAT2_021882 [Lamellibrachia satsuma]